MAVRATTEDRSRNYPEAINLYKNTIEIITKILQQKKNLSTAKKNLLLSKSYEYEERVAKLR